MLSITSLSTASSKAPSIMFIICSASKEQISLPYPSGLKYTFIFDIYLMQLSISLNVLFPHFAVVISLFSSILSNASLITPSGHSNFLFANPTISSFPHRSFFSICVWNANCGQFLVAILFQTFRFLRINEINVKCWYNTTKYNTRRISYSILSNISY